MNDETVTLSRELVDPFANIADHYSDAEDDSFLAHQSAPAAKEE